MSGRSGYPQSLQDNARISLHDHSDDTEGGVLSEYTQRKVAETIPGDWTFTGTTVISGPSVLSQVGTFSIKTTEDTFTSIVTLDSDGDGAGITLNELVFSSASGNNQWMFPDMGGGTGTIALIDAAPLSGDLPLAGSLIYGGGATTLMAKLALSGTTTHALFAGATAPEYRAIAETDVVDGAIFARVAANETITGNWDFDADQTFSGDTADLFWDKSTSRLGLGTVTPSVGIHLNTADGALNSFASQRVGGKFAKLFAGTSGGVFSFDQTGFFWITPASTVTSGSVSANSLGMQGTTGDLWLGSVLQPGSAADRFSIIGNNGTRNQLHLYGTPGGQGTGDYLHVSLSGTEYTAIEKFGRQTAKYLHEAVTAASHTAAIDEMVLLCDCTSNAITVTLPAVASDQFDGKVYIIKKVDSTANAVTIDGNSAETIDDATTQTLTSQYDSITILNDRSEWHII